MGRRTNSTEVGRPTAVARIRWNGSPQDCPAHRHNSPPPTNRPQRHPTHATCFQPGFFSFHNIAKLLFSHAKELNYTLRGVQHCWHPLSPLPVEMSYMPHEGLTCVGRGFRVLSPYWHQHEVPSIQTPLVIKKLPQLVKPSNALAH